MFWTKKKTPEEELLEAQQKEEQAQTQLDSLKERLEKEISIARIRAESELVRKQIQNPLAELKRREQDKEQTTSEKIKGVRR